MLESYESQGKSEALKAACWGRCATDLEYFALRYFPHYCKLKFNELHRDCFSQTEFDQRGIRRARAAPRGYAKSTVEALIKPIHDVCYGTEKFIIILSNTAPQSAQKLRDIRTEILSNPKLIADYGVHFRTKTPGETQYTIYCEDDGVLFASFGAGSEIRGTRFGADRPTKIICDDIEHSEEVENEAIRKKYEDWYLQVISKIGNKNTNIIVIGTILHSDSLLAGLTKNPAYDAKIYRAVKSWSDHEKLWDQWKKIYIDLDNPNRQTDALQFYDKNKKLMLNATDVLWEPHESYLDLMKEMVETGKRAFMKEKQNEPMGGEDTVFDEIHYYRETNEGLFIEKSGRTIPWSEFRDSQGQYLNAFGALDPATGQTKARVGKTPDYSCILVGLKHLDTKRVFVHSDWTKVAPPTKFTAQIFEYHDQYDFQKFVVETNLYRDILSDNLMAEQKRRQVAFKKQIKIPWYEVEQIKNKEERIFSLEPKVTNGNILFNRALSVTMMRQIEEFPRGAHDDAPDCLEMLWNLCNGRYKPMALGLNVMGGR